jgi:hypothetical protein
MTSSYPRRKDVSFPHQQIHLCLLSSNTSAGRYLSHSPSSQTLRQKSYPVPQLRGLVESSTLLSYSTFRSDRLSYPRPSIYDHKRHPFAIVYITSQSTTLHLEHQSSTSLHSSDTIFRLLAYLPGPLEFVELPSSHAVIALARASNVAWKFQFTNSVDVHVRSA